MATPASKHINSLSKDDLLSIARKWELSYVSSDTKEFTKEKIKSFFDLKSKALEEYACSDRRSPKLTFQNRSYYNWTHNILFYIIINNRHNDFKFILEVTNPTETHTIPLDISNLQVRLPHTFFCVSTKNRTSWKSCFRIFEKVYYCFGLC